METLRDLLTKRADRVDEFLRPLLPLSSAPEARLWEAMRYGCLGGGKRIRPFLVLESAAMFDLSWEQALRIGAALELTHCYSLIHDDLPAMDNSDLRRNRPTVHKQFDDATAILAGTGLLTLAFEILSDPLTHPEAETRCLLIAGLARASGASGLLAGQMIDLTIHQSSYAFDDIVRLQTLKTGALIEFALVSGAIAAKAASEQRQALSHYAQSIGLAFQIADDILDIEGSQEQTGKPKGQDVNRKATLISLMGLERARKWSRDLIRQAQRSLDIFQDKGHTLKEFALFVIERGF